MNVTTRHLAKTQIVNMENDGEISQLGITDLKIRPNSVVSGFLVLQLIVVERILKEPTSYYTQSVISVHNSHPDSALRQMYLVRFYTSHFFKYVF